jgi:DNA polymerase-3 subunit gamma/tau
MGQALYRKWRPTRWDRVVGQAHVVQTLRNAIAAERVAHAYLFAGPRGTGKTTTARLLAKAVNCLEPDLTNRPCDACDNCKSVNDGRFLDLIEIDAASNTSVEDVRSLRDKINFSPNLGQFKVYIIYEVHMLSTAAFNALLKTLEEPPKHAIFILATTEIHKIPATVLSRCQRHEFRRIPVQEIVRHLKEMVAAEDLQVDEDALVLIARQSTGAMRDAISLLDQLTSGGGTITLDMAQNVLGTAASQSIINLVEAIASAEAAGGLEEIHTALDAGSDPRQFARQVVDYLRGLLLVSMNNAGHLDATAEVRAQMARQAAGFGAPELLRLIRLFNLAANDARSSWQPALPLEVAFVSALEKQSGGEDEAASSSARKISAPSRVLAQQTPPAAHQAPPAKQAAAAVEELSLEDGDISAPGGITMKQVSDNLKNVLSVLNRMNSGTAALLRSGKLLGVKNGAVYFGLSEVLKSKLDRNENMDLVRKAFRQVLNVDVPVQCVVYAGKAGALPPDVDSDGMVAAALRDLGGEIVDIQ